MVLVIGWAMGCWLGGGGFKVKGVHFYKRNPLNEVSEKLTMLLKK